MALPLSAPAQREKSARRAGRGRRSRRLDPHDLADIHRPLGVPRIIGGLHSKPNVGAVAERLAEPNRHFGRDRLLFVQDVVEMLARNAERKRGNIVCTFASPA